MLQLNTRVQGEGPAIILLHGLFGSMDNMGVIARDLAADYQVVSVDLRNHGHSPHTPTMTYPDMATDIGAVADRYQLDQPVLVGHSMGGKVAMQAVTATPARYKAVVVGDIAPVDYPSRHDQVLAALHNYRSEGITSRRQADEQLSSFVAEPGVRQLLIKSLHRDNDGFFKWRMNAAVLRDSYPVISAAPPLLERQFTGPTLFVRGETSDYVLPEYEQAIVASFPQAVLQVVPEAGHWLHVDNPAFFLAFLREFLAAL